MDLHILIAEPDHAEAELLETAIAEKLDRALAGVNIKVKIVSTLAAVFAHCHESNAIIMDLVLDDATEDQVIAAITSLPEPVIIITDIADPAIHARCELAGALCVMKSNEIYQAILYSLKKSIRKALTDLPE